MHFIIHCALHSLPTWILGINVLFPSVNMDLPILGFACHDWCICYNFPMLPVVLYWTFFSAGCAFRLLDSHFLLCYTDDIAISLVMFCRCSAHLFILLPHTHNTRSCTCYCSCCYYCFCTTYVPSTSKDFCHESLYHMKNKCDDVPTLIGRWRLWRDDEGVWVKHVICLHSVWPFSEKGKLETLASFFGEWWRMTMQIDSPSLQRAAQSRWVCSNCQV
jgi:hypothetical protein